MIRKNQNPFWVHYNDEGLRALMAACALQSPNRQFSLRYEAQRNRYRMTINGFLLIDGIDVVDLHTTENQGRLDISGFCAFWRGLPAELKPGFGIEWTSEGDPVFSCDVLSRGERLHLFSGRYTVELHQELSDSALAPIGIVLGDEQASQLSAYFMLRHPKHAVVPPPALTLVVG